MQRHLRDIVLMFALLTVANQSQANAGTVELCNGGKEKLSYAVWTEDATKLSALFTCSSKGVGCEVAAFGWYSLDVGECHDMQTGLGYRAWLSVRRKGIEPEYAVSENVLSEDSGISGVKRSFCGKRKKFDLIEAGTIDNHEYNACATGYVKIPINVFVRGRQNVRLLLNIM